MNMEKAVVGMQQANLVRTCYSKPSLSASFHPFTRNRPYKFITRAGGYRSFDETNPDALDTDLAAELSALIDPQKKEFQRHRNHMELTWKVANMRRQQAETCSCCQGSAETECEWCHGTGVMMLGDQIYLNERGTNPCPVCKAKGHIKCKNCRGTGFRAVWLDKDADPQAQKRSHS